ncbi:MAG: formylglycine-generating enzyme family protein [Roseimicrobium sp.]
MTPSIALVGSHRCRLGLWLLGISLSVLSTSTFCQTDAKPAPGPHRSSLGVSFVEIPGIPVSVAIWETRVSDFQTFVQESGYTWNHKAHFEQSGDHPVVNVSLRDALAFCNWLTQRERSSGVLSVQESYRLPNKKEWDAAVGLAVGRKTELLAAEREQDKQVFPWGDAWPPPTKAGNFNSDEISGTDDGFAFTSPVGQYLPTSEGLYDLAGNVWEWTWNQEVRADTVGVLRGGSWMYFRKECLLSSYEYSVPAELRAPSVGFRCVFEDKRRVQAFLASAQEAERGKVKEGRSKLESTPTVSQEEVTRMRERMAEKAKREPGVEPTAPRKPAAPGLAYTNSLGMSLQPLSSSSRVFIGAHEVRLQEFATAVAEKGTSWERGSAFSVEQSHPVVNVTWREAVAFCDWLTQKDRAAGLIGEKDRYRLPTDGEWSLAVGLQEPTDGSPESHHLANKTHYPWGNEPTPPGRSGNFDAARMSGYDDKFSHTSPVGAFSPNQLGIYDLAGNVAEWCDDAWPSTPGERVLRGSSWLTSSIEAMLSSARQHLPEASSRTDVGFRVALELAAR